MLNRQAKTLTAAQVQTVLRFLDETRHPIRNRLILLLSVRAGLRAKEVAGLRWSMVTDADGNLTDMIRLTNDAAKGKSGGAIPMAKDLRNAFQRWMEVAVPINVGAPVITSERSQSTSAQAIVNLFAGWYRSLGFDGCSSHSGRRTFITNAARNIGRFGGSIRDVQALARHSSLAMTQRYIEIDTQAMRKVVDV